MRRLVVVLVVLGAILSVADVLARQAAEGQLESRLRRAEQDAQDPTVSIHSFPFLGRLLLSGQVSGIRASLAHVEAGPLVFTTVSVELHDVRLDRNRLVGKRQVDLRHVGDGVVEAVIGERALSDALHVPVGLEPGKVTVTVRGREVTASLTVRDDVLSVTVAGLATYRVKVPDAPLLPCIGEGEVVERAVKLRCTIHEIPDELVRAASRAANRG